MNLDRIQNKADAAQDVDDLSLALSKLVDYIRELEGRIEDLEKAACSDAHG